MNAIVPVKIKIAIEGHIMEFKKEMLISHKCDFVLAMLDVDPSLARCRHCGKGITDDWVPPEPEPEKPLEFAKYRSVHNTSLKKCIKKVRMECFDRYSWVALNKYNGANFSLMVSSERVIPCSRVQIIPVDDNFNGFRLMLPHLTKIVKEMQSFFGKNIQVYFELFGGSYPHPQVQQDERFSRVAKGVYYTTSIDVRVIDIQVDGAYLAYDEMVEITERHKLIPAKEMGRGTFDEMLELEPNFDDPTYKEYNLPKIEGNFSEGLVLRPTKELSFKNDRRCILKKKNPKFAEKKRGLKLPKIETVLSSEMSLALNNLSECITENRLDNLISHGDKWTDKDFSKLIGLMIQDILKEEGEEDYIICLSKSDLKIVKNELQKQLIIFIKPTFIELIQDFG